MDRLVNTALTAMRGAMARQASIANNLANANTVGFRAEIANAETRWIQGESFDTRAQASEQVIAADMAQGAVTETGNPLDVALDGDALLTVQATDGSEAYTRRGDLKVSDSGLLTTGDGLPVLGEGGPVILPQMDSVSIAKDGSIWGVPQGGDPANPQQVDKLKLVNAAGSSIAKGNDGLFREVNGGALPSDPLATVTSGSLEGSNVNSTQALIDMIEASRAWETQVKMIDTAKQLDDGGASLMRLDG
ncbi:MULTISPECIES: flagellar basal body rod protein FlgF [Sphingomonadaceae]|jgi:flagellar basal-body rod protein FlgF|uniref:Flagellar basal-body rod protein FlgF n=1 Tax=Sphingobium soli TaxID=1591116 RepID=A0ABS8H2U7_9SPHN|nr:MULTISPECIES: flagellar basal body rod protein FlgF [Sphingomonadaceae]EAT09819.1 flagellar basal-body rod protein [Sphingomonas sp. SKA58]MAX16214.1 flagellar basal body rod protein FlgF [Sphingobium sp.]MBA38188.1 flagellar basal body rod protein FlgF [Sphingobium sp.]MBS48256.1 flagellar basal body rod protein FlgF [Sphingobium sp.]MCC4232846.1 flagellar basal body rod protein FlgF [Sphingobium soli]|tara:strand:+ start:1130 stop:1873 length:744 start_codon:yes stop_codon:yes gene_type:complete